MKFSLLIFLSIFTSATYAVDLQQVVLEELFVINKGYDSNDDIEITAHGQLPSGCYKIEKVKVTAISNSQFNVQALMSKKRLRGCTSEILSTPVNFTKTISLGELPAGQYEFLFETKEGQKSKAMDIAVAQRQTIDDNFYAPISNAFIPELIFTTQSPNVVLTGIFHTNCFQLNNQNIQVVRDGNIFIILPKSTLISLNRCNQQKYPIQQIVGLGNIKEPGHYLIHVRSLNGLSINRVFHVEPKYSANRGSL